MLHAVGIKPAAIRRIEPVAVYRPALPRFAGQGVAGEDTQQLVSHPRNARAASLSVLDGASGDIEQGGDLVPPWLVSAQSKSGCRHQCPAVSHVARPAHQIGRAHV